MRVTIVDDVNNQEIEFHGDVSMDWEDVDGGEAWGAKFSPSKRQVYICNEITFTCELEELADVAKYLNDQYDYIEGLLIAKASS